MENKSNRGVPFYLLFKDFTLALNLDLSGDRRSAAFATVDKRAETNS